ncbi:hypothetical protein L2E82_48374 [Cichorium intybus]|uniref:Uncharacterized protein n=1 Tax=Cichorium intybus TaxID=13427 RepID=A0ACB8YZ79_CICIN|nr:hypothetical protein L2E82_48374 [Cichorium intybus]
MLQQKASHVFVSRLVKEIFVSPIFMVKWSNRYGSNFGKSLKYDSSEDRERQSLELKAGLHPLKLRELEKGVDAIRKACASLESNYQPPITFLWSKNVITLDCLQTTTMMIHRR